MFSPTLKLTFYNSLVESSINYFWICILLFQYLQRDVWLIKELPGQNNFQKNPYSKTQGSDSNLVSHHRAFYYSYVYLIGLETDWTLYNQNSASTKLVF